MLGGYLQETTTVFCDLHAQPYDLISPRLVQQLRLGFYAGSALRTQAGYPTEVLCVIDHQPRSFSPAEATLLERLATVAMSLLDLRLLQQPTRNQQLWASIYQRIKAPVARLDALASLAGHEQAATSEAAHTKILRIIKIITEQVHALRS